MDEPILQLSKDEEIERFRSAGMLQQQIRVKQEELRKLEEQLGKLDYRCS